MLNPTALSNLEDLDKATLITMIIYHRKNEERQKQAKLGLSSAASAPIQPVSSPERVDRAERAKSTPRKGLRRKQSVGESKERIRATIPEHELQEQSPSPAASGSLTSRSLGRKKSVSSDKSLKNEKNSDETPKMGETKLSYERSVTARNLTRKGSNSYLKIPQLEANFLSLEEMVQDSPVFRRKLLSVEAATEGFLDSITRIASATEVTCQMNQSHARQMEVVAAGLNGMRDFLSCNTALDNNFKQSCLFLTRFQNEQNTLYENLTNEFLKPIRAYAEIQQKEIQSLSSDYHTHVYTNDLFISKYARKVTTKTVSMWSEMEKMEKKRQEIGVQFINRLNSIAMSGKVDFLISTLVMIMHFMNYHNSCSENCANGAVNYQEILDQLQDSRPKITQVISSFPLQPSDLPKSEQKSMRGYLHHIILSGKANKTKTPNWERAYVQIDYGYLIISRLMEDGKIQKTRWNLLLCGNVKSRTDLDRMFVFEMTAMVQDDNGRKKPKTLLLQADNADSKNHWMTIISQTIQELLSSQKSVSTSKVKIPTLTLFSLAARNNECVDCTAPSPDWASLNLGIMMCLQCSGAHRGLSTTVSKVRSISLDSWDVYAYKLLDSLGNSDFNKLMHSNDFQTLSREASQNERENFIRLKYIQKSFMLPSYKDQDQHNSDLMDAVVVGELNTILTAIMYGADPNFVDPATGETALIRAALNQQYLAAQLLLSNGASPDFKYGADGSTALHIFAKDNDANGIALLIAANASKDIKDNTGNTPQQLCQSPQELISRAFLGFVPTTSKKETRYSGSSGENLGYDLGKLTGRRTRRTKKLIESRQQEAHERILEMFEQNCVSTEESSLTT